MRTIVCQLAQLCANPKDLKKKKKHIQGSTVQEHHIHQTWGLSLYYSLNDTISILLL